MDTKAIAKFERSISSLFHRTLNVKGDCPAVKKLQTNIAEALSKPEPHEKIINMLARSQADKDLIKSLKRKTGILQPKKVAVNKYSQHSLAS